MRKYISAVIIAFSLSFLAIGEAQAHSVVVSSDPEDGATVEEELTAVSMTFDTSIQQEEDIYIEDSESERIDPEDVTIDNDTIEVSLSEPLSSGDYTIFWEVYGADGHLVNGEIDFSVDADTSGESADETPVDSEEQENVSASNDDEGGGMATSTIIMIIGLAVVGIGVIVFFIRKRS